jgi:hypothetical protein
MVLMWPGRRLDLMVAVGELTRRGDTFGRPESG